MNYGRIPEDTLTFKDLSFLSDMFQSCYDAYKRTGFGLKFIHDSDVLDIYQESLRLFDEKLKLAIHILKDPGGNF